MDCAPGLTVDLSDRLPDAAALFSGAPFQSSAAWWRCTLAAAMPPTARPLFAICRDGLDIRALLPLQALSHRLTGLVTPYTCLYQPLLHAGADDAEIAGIGAAFGHALRRWPSLRLDGLDADWPPLMPLLTGLRRSGWHHYRFDAFGNWHEPLAGRDWVHYLADRPGPLRETIRRKLRRAGNDLTFRIARTAAEAAVALPIYRDVYRRSWKQPEPFPDFDTALLSEAAALGVLRLGILQHAGQAVAAQYWIVADGVATVLKLAHDEAAKALSPGTVLTAMMLRHLIEVERLTALDFGRGDDPYKRAWATRRRQRIGLVLARTAHPAGLAMLAQHAASTAIRNVLRLLSGKFYNL